MGKGKRTGEAKREREAEAEETSDDRRIEEFAFSF
jgi:hypothetical protein